MELAYKNVFKQDRQYTCTYNATLTRVRATIHALEKK